MLGGWSEPVQQGWSFLTVSEKSSWKSSGFASQAPGCQALPPYTVHKASWGGWTGRLQVRN